MNGENGPILHWLQMHPWLWVINKWIEVYWQTCVAQGKSGSPGTEGACKENIVDLCFYVQVLVVQLSLIFTFVNKNPHLIIIHGIAAEVHFCKPLHLSVHKRLGVWCVCLEMHFQLKLWNIKELLLCAIWVCCSNEICIHNNELVSTLAVFCICLHCLCVDLV